MLETVKTLCALSGVSGWEDEVRDYILTRVMPHADAVETDAMGNLFVEKKGRVTPTRRILLAAHMDEVGLIVTSVTEEGYLKFAFIGGVDRRVVLGKRVLVGPEKFPGVIGLKAFHLVDSEEADRVPKLESLYIDIGAESREEALARVHLGDVCTFADTVEVLGGRLLRAKALDDRVGCAAMLKLIEADDLPCDCTFVFTVQEEVGTRGASIAAFRVQPDLALILEGTTAADLPSVEAGQQICNLTDGVVIPFMDGGTVYDRAMYRRLTELAEAAGIPWQTKQRIAGGTDASAIQRSCIGVRAAGLAVAIRNIHSPADVCAIADLDNMVKLARLFLASVAERDI